mmetsp:Transcript_29841/g.88596  ORF Transcript_29841/g.88596 Transcript_29841/m.88596 type:complete len:235 (+) Transcript_29841:220-924(+)
MQAVTSGLAPYGPHDANLLDRLNTPLEAPSSRLFSLLATLLCLLWLPSSAASAVALALPAPLAGLVRLFCALPLAAALVRLLPPPSSDAPPPEPRGPLGFLAFLPPCLYVPESRPPHVQNDHGLSHHSSGERSSASNLNPISSSLRNCSMVSLDAPGDDGSNNIRISTLCVSIHRGRSWTLLYRQGTRQCPFSSWNSRSWLYRSSHVFLFRIFCTAKSKPIDSRRRICSAVRRV